MISSDEYTMRFQSLVMDDGLDGLIGWVFPVQQLMAAATHLVKTGQVDQEAGKVDLHGGTTNGGELCFLDQWPQWTTVAAVYELLPGFFPECAAEGFSFRGWGSRG